jgi:hypothetical protein
MDDIRNSAELFEELAEQYREHLGITIVTRQMQKDQHFQKQSEALKQGLNCQPLPTAPDFLLKKTIKIIAQNEGLFVHWIELRHFYGASSIPMKINQLRVASSITHGFSVIYMVQGQLF